MRSTRSSFPTVVLLTVILSALGCEHSRSARTSAGVVATIDGEPLATESFDRFLHVKLGDFAGEPLNDRVRSELLDEFVKREVAARAARDVGLEVDQPEGEVSSLEDTKVLDEVLRDRLVEKYFHDVVLKNVSVTPEEVERYYEEHRDEYNGVSGLYVREIRVETRDAALQARDEVASGKTSFSDVAARVSLAPNARKGGLSYYEEASLPPFVARATKGLADGQISQVVQSSFGFHVFLLERRVQSLPFDRLRERIETDLLATKNARLVEQSTERLLSKANVEIHREQLRFDYKGRFSK